MIAFSFAIVGVSLFVAFLILVGSILAYREQK